MMKKHRPLILKFTLKKSLIISVFIFQVACNKKDDSLFIIKANKEHIEHFQSTEDKEFKSLFEFSGGNVTRILEIDSQLLLFDVKGLKNQFVHLYDLEKKETLAGLFNKGNGPFESNYPYSIGIIDSKIWLQDFTMLKIIFFDFNDSVYSEKKVPFDLYGINFLAENKILGSLINESAFKFQFIDIEQNIITKEFGEFYKYPENLEQSTLQSYFQRKSMVRLDKKLVATAYRWHNAIEITDLNDLSSKIIYSPDKVQNENDIIEYDGKLIFDRSGTTKKCYNDIFVTDNFIYAIFSGLEDDIPNSGFCKIIHIYDWEGNPIKQINLDRGVLSISVNSDDSRIYSFDIDTGEVIYIDL